VPAVVVTPRAKTRAPDVSVIEQPGRWSPADLSAVAARAVRQMLRLP